MPKGMGPNAETSAETRRRALAAGAARYLDAQLRDPFRNVSLTDVAKDIGITRNGLAYHWETKNDFSADLAAYLLADDSLFDEDFAHITRVVAKARKLVLYDAIARVADADLSTLASNPLWPAMEVLNVTIAAEDPRLRQLAADGYTSLDETTWTRIYGGLCERAGRVPRPPFTATDIGAILQAMVEGAAMRQRVEPETFGVKRADGATLFGAAVAAILSAMTVRADETGPVVFEEELNRR